MEKSFIMVKPDGVQRGLVGTITKRFERRGYKLLAIKIINPSEDLLKEHYKDLANKPFFNTLIKHMSKGPVVPMVWEGPDIVTQGRKIIGATDPLKSDVGTIRGDFSVDTGRNLVHGSDSIASANKEINLWFKPEELTQWNCHSKEWITE